MQLERDMGYSWRNTRVRLISCAGAAVLIIIMLLININTEQHEISNQAFSESVLDQYEGNNCSCQNKATGVQTIETHSLHEPGISVVLSEQTQQWQVTRQELLAGEGASKVFLFSYMRGGSSTAGQLFNQESSAMMLYEPLDAFYMTYFGVPEENLPQQDLYFSNMTRRQSATQDMKWLSDFITNQLTCRFDKLPTEFLSHHFLQLSGSFKKYVRCMGPKIQRDYTLARCTQLISPICGTTVQSSTLQRCDVVLETTREVFQQNPDLVWNMMDTPSNDLTSINTYTEKASGILLQALQNKGYFTPLILGKLKWFILHQLCLDRQRLNVNKCIDQMVEECMQSSTRVLQVNRMKMEDLDPILEKNPDLHVIHFVRDPRAIAVSRIKTDHLIWNIADKSPLTEARITCSKMYEDVQQMHHLSTKYPGAFSRFKYEDLVKDANGVAQEIYGLLGKSPPAAWLEFAQNTMHASQDGGPWNYLLKDAVANLIKWRNDVSLQELTDMTSYCRPLLMELGYEL